MNQGIETLNHPRFRFFIWNDMHMRGNRDLRDQYGNPYANEKAAWALECAMGKHGFDAPDFIVSAGDLINGGRFHGRNDFSHLKWSVLDKLDIPLLPCLGNHEREPDGENAEPTRTYDQLFGPEWHNYVFTYGGIGFIMVDTSGGNEEDSYAISDRNAFLKRAFDRFEKLPLFVVTHIPLIPMRDDETLRASFGFPSWRLLDGEILDIIESHADSVIAILCGHLHLTGVRKKKGIYHIAPAGTNGYPADFASLEVFESRIEVRMHPAPREWLNLKGNLHGRLRHSIDYTDADHPDHESYLWGNPEERAFTILLEGAKRPAPDAPCKLAVFHEAAPGQWDRRIEVSLLFPAKAVMDRENILTSDGLNSVEK